VLVAEIVGAALSGSLALLADAGHMSSDAIGLVVALIATVVAARPATDRHTFGFQRVEVLAALLNGVLLSVVAVSVAIEAIRRLSAPADAHVLAVPMLIVAGVGLLANIAAMLVLRGGDRRSLNMRGAYLEVVGDLLGSIAALGAAAVILITGFAQADASHALLQACGVKAETLQSLRRFHLIVGDAETCAQKLTMELTELQPVHVSCFMGLPDAAGSYAAVNGDVRQGRDAAHSSCRRRARAH